MTTSTTPQGALVHLLEHVLTSDTDTLISFFEYHGIEDINDFMSFSVEDFGNPYSTLDNPTALLSLSTSLIKKLLSVQSWYVSKLQESGGATFTIFYSLTQDTLTAWRNAQMLTRFSIEPTAPSTPKISPIAPSFRNSIKINISDYPKLKDETQWRAFNRQLRATAASHDTLDILDPTFVPSADAQASFRDKQRFMYNVFTNIILTTKGKNCVREECETMDAQKVYAALLDVYHDQLSTKLSATKLRQELTLMKLDDKWRKTFESFLHFWTAKVQELEGIEDKPVDDDVKRIWLTNTLSSQTDMDAAIRQAITTELTIHGTKGSSTTATIPWTNFYNMVLSNAKLLDSTRSKQSGRRQETNQTNRTTTSRNNQSQRANRPSTNSQKSYTTYTGPNMVMESGMFFSTNDWKKLSKAQKDKLSALKKQRINTRTTNNSSNTTTDHSSGTTSTSTTVNTTNISTTPSPPPTTSGTYDIRQLLSNNASRDSASVPTQLVIDGRTYTLSYCTRTYSLHQTVQDHGGSLIDGGANGGLSGSDVVVLNETTLHADVTGIANNTITQIPICTVAGLIQTQHGPIIGIFHQYAHQGTGKTIHSVSQLRHFGTIVDDTPRQFGGKQRLETLDGYIIPLSIRSGLPYMDMSPPTQHELDCYPHVFFTADTEWHPQSISDEYPVSSLELTEEDMLLSDYHPNSINSYGELLPFSREQDVHFRNVKPLPMDLDKLSPNFGFVPSQRIQHTLDHTTRFARLDTRLPLRKHFKSRFPAANVNRLNEVVATDTYFSDTPALDDGIMGHGGTTMVQLFCGCSSLLTAVYPMRRENNIAGTLEDFIRHHGAPNALFSDNAKSQIGRAVQEILRMYAIKDFQCEPHHQHQNFAERRIQEVKKLSNTLLDRSGSPPNLWLLCVQHVVYILNHLSTESLKWKTPIEAATGQQPDISAILAFHWYEPVYYKHYKSSSSSPSYPSESSERLGRIVGIAEHKGDCLTFLVLDSVTSRVVARSELRSGLTTTLPNFRSILPPDGGESSPKIIQSTTDLAGLDINPSDLKMPRFSPDELIGKTFVRTLDNGNNYKATVLRKIQDQEAENHSNIKFLIELGDGEFDEIIGYNTLCECIEDLEDEDIEPEEKVWTFKEVLAHQGPLKKSDKDYKGSLYNVKILWDDGSETYEPLEMVIKDDPVTLAAYARKHKLLDQPVWKKLKTLARRLVHDPEGVHHLHYNVMANKLTTGPIYQFGIEVPRNVKHAYELDKKNGNTKWQDAMRDEINSLLDYSTFEDKGSIKYLPGYKNIRVHFVFAVKHDLRHKARLVAGGHLTDPSTTDSTYSSVVSLRSMRIAISAAELNKLGIMVGDVSSAYLEAFTQEKVCFIAGPEFGPLEGHLLVIVRALYGLRTSGARWHDRYADVMRTIGFYPCKADPDVWMKDCRTHYEYVLVYVDDLMFIGKEPQAFFDSLTNEHGFKLKGVGKPSYHLGGDFFRDSDGTLAWGAKSYVSKMLTSYETMFGCKPKEYSTPMIEKDHPEIDQSDLLDTLGIKQYQSLIGALQWLVTLGRFDIHLAVATMSSYRVAPRIGHLDRLKRVYGYLKRNPSGAIRFRTKIPNHESVATPVQYDWSSSIYGNVKEELPPDMPTPRGKAMRTTTYQDANLYHDLVTGRAMSGIFHFVNQTPIISYCKKQKTVETATYGSEFMVARHACEQIMDLRYTLRMMGIPIDGPAWMFGDNASVITSSTIPQSTLNKRHNALSYHRVRECLAAKIIYLLHIDGKYNPSDVLTKPLGYTTFWPLIQPLFFWKGETILNKPYPIIIKQIKDDPSSALRGVTDENDNN